MSDDMSAPIDPTRRGFLAGLVAGTALLSSGAAFAMQSLTKDSHLPGASTPLARALDWIRPGVGVTDDWRIGACRLEGGGVIIDVVSTAGDSFRLDMCRRGGGAPGIETTAHFDFRLMNEGSGSGASTAAHHQPTRIIAEVVRRSEDHLSSAPAELTTHQERLALFHAGDLRHPAPVV